MPIFVIDEFDPEATAMLQALYSRSSKSVIEHVEKVKQTGSAKFMESYYVGYGHASIGDCGTTTIFIEDVSILAAKVLQDNPLYSGQESSTRYIDFSKQPMVNPVGSSAAKAIQLKWLEFYLSSQDRMVESLKARFPLEAGQKETIWEKAIKARSFDVLRGFLPAGMCTQLSWTTNLRQAADNIQRLEAHPMEEIRDIARHIKVSLSEKYPSSFSHREDAGRTNYLESFYAENAYLLPEALESGFEIENLVKDSSLLTNLPAINSRPQRVTLPRNVANLARYKLKLHLDYGSFRDLQRHRNGFCPLPLLTQQVGFNSWYLEQLPSDLREDAIVLIEAQEGALRQMTKEGISDLELQYYIPMGYNVYVELEYDLSEMIYVSELRSNTTVHPTLREIAWKMGNHLESEIPGISIYIDRSTDDFDIRRGTQDIVEKS